MRIYTIWHEGYGDDLPWLVDAVDEYTVDENGVSPEYAKKLNEPHHRELIIDIPESAVRKLFEAPEVKAEPCEQ